MRAMDRAAVSIDRVDPRGEDRVADAALPVGARRVRDHGTEPKASRAPAPLPFVSRAFAPISNAPCAN